MSCFRIIFANKVEISRKSTTRSLESFHYLPSAVLQILCENCIISIQCIFITSLRIIGILNEIYSYFFFYFPQGDIGGERQYNTNSVLKKDDSSHGLIAKSVSYIECVREYY